MTTTRKIKNLGPLHDILLDQCPADRQGNKSITVLAKKMKLSPWGVYKWIGADKIPADQVLALVKICGQQSRKHLLPYAYVNIGNKMMLTGEDAMKAVSSATAS